MTFITERGGTAGTLLHLNRLGHTITVLLEPLFAILTREQGGLEIVVVTVHHSTHEQDAWLPAHVVQRTETILNLHLHALAPKHVRGEGIAHSVAHCDITLVLFPFNLARKNILNLGDVLTDRLVCHELIRSSTHNRTIGARRAHMPRTGAHS